MEVDTDTTPKVDPRRNPFTLMEKEYLVDLVEEHKDILDPVIRYNDSMTVFKRKQSWRVIEEKYNAKFKENIRDVDQLKRMWSKIKIQIKKYMNIPRTEENIWNLARMMFHQHTRNGREDIPKNIESTLTQLSARKDAALSQIESETNGENSTTHTNASSDDDLIILNVVSEKQSRPTADQSDVEVLNNKSVTNGFEQHAGSQNKNTFVCGNEQSEIVPIVQIDRTQFVNTNYQNVIGSNDSGTVTNQSQEVQNADHVNSFAYSSRLTENMDEQYSLWQNIHSLDDNLTSETSPSGIGDANVRSRTSRRYQHGLGSNQYLLNTNRVPTNKNVQFYSKNRSFKRKGNRPRSIKRSRRDGEELYEEGRVEDSRLDDGNFLSESAYRKRVLALAEEEHAQKIRVLKLKCEVLELQKQELISKLQK